MGRGSELIQKAAVLIGFALLCGLIGLFAPLLIDRDVGGTLASALLGIAGVALGLAFGILTIRRNFD